jgi:hypothetical protein
MGWTYYDLRTLPNPGDIVWCKWPYKEDRGGPGKVVRPALVREVFENAATSGESYGSLIVSHGTGNLNAASDDLVVSAWDRVRALGLHKPTRFSLDPADRKHLLWCEEFFVPPGYGANQSLRLGSLGEQELDAMRACLTRRGLLITPTPTQTP